jgi:RNA polymerase sigma factor (sigma-70 family)
MTTASSQLVEQLFRRESARLTATVIRLVRDIDRAEEVVQETLLAALERWPFSGVPDNPAAWLMVTAKNRALDIVRRDRGFDRKVAPVLRADGATAAAAEPPEAIADDLLRLVFTCCHPELPRESQVALTLKLLGGLSTGEIARAFLSPEPTVAQRIVRAKRTIAERAIPYEVPGRAELPGRLPSVLEVIYLVFNEGYAAREGDTLLRTDLCEEAIRLGTLVAELMPDEAEVLGLCALMELQASRSRARVGPDGDMVLMADQDRSRWDAQRIARGFEHLDRARHLGPAGHYRLQAQIAACHAAAPSWEGTDWRIIVELYGRLAELSPSPVIELNRAAAVSMLEGPAAALVLLDDLTAVPALRDYHLLPAARADLLRRLRRWGEAADEYRRARTLTKNVRERAFLDKRIAECDAALASEAS